MIESIHDVAFSSKEEVNRCTFGVRFTDGRVIQCQGLQEIVDEPNSRTLWYHPVLAHEDFTSYALLIYNEQGQLVHEREFSDGSQRLLKGDTLTASWKLNWYGNQAAKEPAPTCSLSLSLRPGPVSQPLSQCAWESLSTPS